jgi:hypothetical protein
MLFAIPGFVVSRVQRRHDRDTTTSTPTGSPAAEPIPQGLATKAEGSATLIHLGAAPHLAPKWMRTRLTVERYGIGDRTICGEWVFRSSARL